MNNSFRHYKQQFLNKQEQLIALLKPFVNKSNQQKLQCFPSPAKYFRSRIEFALKYFNNELQFAMFDGKQKRPIAITESTIVLPAIAKAMPELIQYLREKAELNRRCFQVNFRANREGELLISLLYHRQLDENWQMVAQDLHQQTGWNIIGRYHKHKCLAGKDYLDYKLQLDNQVIVLRQNDNTFSQPNPYTNEQMLNFGINNLQSDADLLELYCGNGGISLALASQFTKVLATEVVKQSLQLAQHNQQANQINNVYLARLSAAETLQALKQVRLFRRLQHIDLKSFDLQTLVVDPPRCGLDSNSLEWFKSFPTILYYSCNPTTLCQDLQKLCRTHKVSHWAMFDQFPYTPHLECAALLKNQKIFN